MEKRVMSREELMENKDSLLAAYYGTQPRSKKVPLLSKRERQVLGIGRDVGKATLTNCRMSSRKAKIVLDLIRGKDINEAYGILMNTPKGASEILYKLLKSAVSNAVNNNDLDEDDLYVAEVYANQGPTLKRMRPRARGSAFRINKRTCHITIVVKERIY